MPTKTSTKTAHIKGVDELVSNLKVYDENMTDAVADAMRKFGGMVESESTRRCPVQTGELRSRVFNDGPLKDGEEYVQVVGYEKFGALWGKENPEMAGTPYAVKVHEDTSAYHHVGEAKFLEHAVEALSGEYAEYMQKVLKEVEI